MWDSIKTIVALQGGYVADNIKAWVQRHPGVSAGFPHFPVLSLAIGFWLSLRIYSTDTRSSTYK
ncbi:hypothetical protein EYF80_004545 [Liparis tanakae]|uniref:Uncharacterized protein n=1 Tax=Liparis tanakae TaxID=230148 RepID=A0A4Z2J4B7_9TELE|nr:hypothetical protein EYF80_004545 [Liparis tanakae]